MWMIRWCGRHIILIWGLLAVVDAMAIALLDLQYDDGDVGTLANLLFALLGQPIFWVASLLDKFGMNIRLPSTEYAALALGLAGCIALDLAIQALLRRTRSAAGASGDRPDARP